MTAELKHTNPTTLPTPVGYSQIVEVRAARLFFIAGQVPVDINGEIVGASNFEAQAEQVFKNLVAALESIGCTARDLVRLTVFMRDMDNRPIYRAARVSALVPPRRRPYRPPHWWKCPGCTRTRSCWKSKRLPLRDAAFLMLCAD